MTLRKRAISMRRGNRSGGTISMLRQHPENVGVILRISKPLSGDQAAADIQACLDRHLKAAFDRAFQASILDVCLERADFIPFAF